MPSVQRSAPDLDARLDGNPAVSFAVDQENWDPKLRQRGADVEIPLERGLVLRLVFIGYRVRIGEVGQAVPRLGCCFPEEKPGLGGRSAVSPEFAQAIAQLRGLSHLLLLVSGLAH